MSLKLYIVILVTSGARNGSLWKRLINPFSLKVQWNVCLTYRTIVIRYPFLPTAGLSLSTKLSYLIPKAFHSSLNPPTLKIWFLVLPSGFRAFSSKFVGLKNLMSWSRFIFLHGECLDKVSISVNEPFVVDSPNYRQLSHKSLV